MAQEHHFDPDIAKEYGIAAAVILHNLAFWIRKNIANESNYFDGNYWTYSSMKALGDIFPYLTQKQIRTAIQRLIDDGMVVTGNYNKSAYDRTLWYALTKKARTKLLFGDFHLPSKSNENAPEGKPIPYNSTDNNTDNRNKCIYSDVISYLNEKAGTKYRATTDKTKSLINARVKNGFTLDDFKTVIDKKCAQWIGTDMEKYLRPETLFGTKFEGYLNEKVTPRNTQPQDDWDGDSNPFHVDGDNPFLRDGSNPFD